MRRSMLLVLVALVMAAMMAVGAGAALAEPPGVEFRDGPANPNANCIGTASSDATHNGQASTLGQGGDPSHGTRGAEIQAAQANPAC
jgi:hypothetical protein